MINNRQGGRRRGRGGTGRPQGGGNPNPGNRQDNRQRGNAAQLLEKYKGLARDAQMQGDRVQTETYLQYADHYFRVLGESRARFEEQRRQRGDDFGDDYEDQEQDQEAEGADGSESDEPREADPHREAREERGDRNGEFRSPRRGRGRRDEQDGNGRAEREDADEERIALDVLPPAISPVNEDAPSARAPRARRPRRPRDDEDVAPAA